MQPPIFVYYNLKNFYMPSGKFYLSKVVRGSKAY